jgi:hypothetical protein
MVVHACQRVSTERQDMAIQRSEILCPVGRCTPLCGDLAMDRVVEAIYEQGALKLLDPGSRGSGRERGFFAQARLKPISPR